MDQTENRSTSAGLATAYEPTKDTQINAELSKLTDVSIGTQDLVGELCRRLDRVARPETPIPGNEPVSKELVPLANEIRGQRRRINETNTMLVSLLERLEV